MSEVDWVGEWMPIIEKHGEHPYIVIGTRPEASADSSPTEWAELPHHQFDGFSGLSRLLRQYGMELAEPPLRKRTPPPGFLKAILVLLYFFWDSRLRKPKWKNPDYAWKGKSSGITWHVFSPSETQAVLDRIHSAGVSVTADLLHGLDRSVRKLAFSSSESNRWMIPVDMRGALTRPSVESNHSSYLGVDVSETDGSSEIHLRIRRLLFWGYEWAAWWNMNVGRWLGRSYMAGVIDYYYRNHHSWCGTFSNLGKWDTKGNPERAFLGIGVPPVFQAHPIAAGCVTWRGRLSIGVQIHPLLSKNIEDTRLLLESWKSEIKSPH